MHNAGDAACGWLDVTADGDHLPTWRRSLTAHRLDELYPDMVPLAGIGKSGRSTLARLLDDHDTDRARSAALVWARRNGEDGIRHLVTTGDVTTVRNLVALSRWWRR